MDLHKRRSLGIVIYTCRQSSMQKQAKILHDGTLLTNADGRYKSMAEWLDLAPLRNKFDDNDIKQWAREAAQSDSNQDFDDDDDGGRGRGGGRGRSRSGMNQGDDDIDEDNEDEMMSSRTGRSRSYTVLGPAETSVHSQPPTELLTLYEELRDDEAYFAEETGDEFDEGLDTGVTSANCPKLFRKLSVWCGDPSNLAVDVLFRSAERNLVSTNRGTDYWPAAIERAGAAKLLLNCQAYLSRCKVTALEPSHIVVTPGYELPCKFILHIVATATGGTIEQYYKAAFEKCLQEKYKLIGITLLGDDDGFDFDESVKALLDQLFSYDDDALSHVERIVIAHDDDMETSSIRHEINERASLMIDHVVS